jgi:hypothetical protein
MATDPGGHCSTTSFHASILNATVWPEFGQVNR